MFPVDVYDATLLANNWIESQLHQKITNSIQLIAASHHDAFAQLMEFLSH